MKKSVGETLLCFRHEPPVTAEPIQVISDTEDIVVVNKPSSIPVRFSLTSII